MQISNVRSKADEYVSIFFILPRTTFKIKKKWHEKLKQKPSSIGL